MSRVRLNMTGAALATYTRVKQLRKNPTSVLTKHSTCKPAPFLTPEPALEATLTQSAYPTKPVFHFQQQSSKNGAHRAEQAGTARTWTSSSVHNIYIMSSQQPYGWCCMHSNLLPRHYHWCRMKKLTPRHAARPVEARLNRPQQLRTMLTHYINRCHM